ncbi:hypothetical protein [Bacterioplanoides sp.]|uniref:hypothetical protein n=1 Tax=Bacterioplanoides sp. TaxID=2066072 RepID=UPI003B59C8DE
MSNLSDFVPTGGSGGGSEIYTISWSAPVATGGETVLSPPHAFTKAMLFINGAHQDETRGAFTIANNQLTLASPLIKGDEAQVLIGLVIPPGTSDWNLMTGDTTAMAGQKILLDSSAGAFTVTLPASPGDGELIDFVDVGNALDTNPVSLNRNGKRIMGAEDNLTLDTSLVSLQLLYSNAELGWRILE